MLTDIVSNIYNNLINFITGQNAQDRFVNLLDSSPNILSDKDQTDGYVGTDSNNEMLSIYYNENDTRANIVTKSVAGLLVPNKFYQINDAVGGTIALQVCAENALILHNFAIDLQTGEIGTYDITTDVFSPIVSSAQTLAQTLILGNTSGANDIEFDATQGLLFSNASRLREGTIDAGLGGLKGIAQICGAGYELKWENGRLYVMGSSGNTIRQSLYNFNVLPTTDEDDMKGYAIGSLWTLDDGTTYECTDNSTGSAVWVNKGNAFIVQIAFGNLAALEGASALSLTTIYVVTDAPYRIALKAEAVNKIGANGTIIDLTFSGSVYYDLATNTILNGTMSDIDGNTWNGCLPTDVILGADCFNNTFGQGSNGFIFGDDLKNVTIEAGITGADYSNATTYAFLYNKAYASTIFQSGGINYHRYFDIANDRIEITDLATPANITFIGGGTGGDVYLANDQTFTGENTFAIGSGNDTPVTITKGGSNAALKVTKSSGSGDAIEVADGSVSIADETASTIAHFDGSKRIKSLATSTYPSLTELALVKGVGSQVVGTTDTNTLTNKRITARTGTTTSNATPTINTDNVDYYSITALAAAITSFTTNLSGTPTIGQTLWISIKDNGTARAIAWGASFEASTIALPTTTVISTRLDVAFIWNEATSVWRCVGVA